MPDFDAFVEEIRPLWDSRWLTNRGEKVRQLESELNAYLGVSHSALTVNGHMALETLLQAFELKGEVITTPFTFASTTHAIVRSGLTPVFADIKPNDYTIDPASIEALITPQTSAIVPVHIYGTLCDVDAIQDIADRHGLKVIYDAAHAFGVERDGVGAAAFGDASMFSFHATKVFNTIEGGLAVVQDEAMLARVKHLQNFGITGRDQVGYVGGNAKMNEFSAAMGLCNLRTVRSEIQSRASVEARYRQHLNDVPGLILLNPVDGVESNFAYFPITIDPETFGASRDDLHDCLAIQGVYTRKYFYPLVTDFDVYNDRFNSSMTPVAQRAADQVLTLPLYADLQTDDVDRICAAVKSVGLAA
ncbi:DegT/DnrJ/EryC1/StrS family aminotransferase [Brevibacterium luteolum]|nr:DegT/DnrJ/EryC1/StrS family aminotransferase [Brevibacterium luteolum]